MAHRKIAVEYNLNGNPTATVYIAENYRTTLEKGGILPRIRTHYDKLYKVMVTVTGIISAAGNPEFEPQLFGFIRTELMVRSWVNKYSRYILLAFVLGAALITGMAMFTELLSDAGAEMRAVAIAEVWKMILSSVALIVSAIVAAYAFRLVLGQVTIFRPHAEVFWKEGTLHLNVTTEAEHSGNRRALPTGDLQKLAWPLKLIVHQGDDSAYGSAIRASDAAMDNYITIPAPGERVGVYRINGVSGHYIREQPPFLHDGGTWEFSNINYLLEGNKQHAAYCAAFAKHIGPWGDEAIVSLGLTSGDQITDKHSRAYQAGRTVTFVITLLLLATSAFATKTQQVLSGINTRANDVPAADTKVEYTFQGKTFIRTGNGNESLIQLLQNGKGFTEEENAGMFLGVTYGNTKIVATKPQASTDPVRPRPLFPEAVGSSAPSMVYDSAHIALAADETIQWIQNMKRSIVKKGGIWWYVRIVAWPIISLLLLPGAWFWTVSYSAGKETDVRQFYKDFFFRVHEFSAIGCWILILIPVLYSESEAFVQLFIERDGEFWSMVMFGGFTYMVALLYAGIVPNRTGTHSTNRNAPALPSGRNS